MHLSFLDWAIVIGCFAITFIIGFSTIKSAGKSKDDFFVGNRSMPWWLLGFSMVATTFSTDTPNLVTDFVRQHGVFGNWAWWAMLPGSMLTVFFFAKLWRRSRIITDVEFYELRYSGKLAGFLRGFKAIFQSTFLTVISIAGLTMATIKISGAMLNLTPLQTICCAMALTAVFSAAGGLKGVLLSDMFLFIIAMIGSVAAAYFSLQLPEIGGLSGMVEKLSANQETAWKMNVMSWNNSADFIQLFIIPLALVWWCTSYPGAEPGGGGFLVQRMLSAKDSKQAVSATLFFNIMHYAVRPWPWLLVALCSIIIFPTHDSLVAAVGDVLPAHQIKDDIAYSLMLTKIPHGWRGIVIASLAAAFVSTLSTLLNLGSSYFVNDLYARFIRPKSSNSEQVWAGRFYTLFLVLISAVIALYLTSASSLFDLFLSVAAGTGLVLMLRWFWWRINALTELVAMVSAVGFSIYFNVIHPHVFPQMPISPNVSLLIQTILVTLCWLPTLFIGPSTDKTVLYEFCRKVNPAGAGWRRVRQMAAKENVDLSVNGTWSGTESLGSCLIATIVSTAMVYAVLFAIGEYIYGRLANGVIGTLVAILCAFAMKGIWKKIRDFM